MNVKQPISMIDARTVKKYLIYDPNSGDFFWRAHRSNRVRKGGKAGGYCGNNGYLFIRLQKKLYRAHRLAWLIVYGKWPKNEIDHINGVRDDNRLVNLREATSSDNSRNSAIRVDNTSKVTGVCWHKAHRRWCSRMIIKGKTVHARYFREWWDAVCDRKAQEHKYNFHPNHGTRRSNYAA